MVCVSFYFPKWERAGGEGRGGGLTGKYSGRTNIFAIVRHGTDNFHNTEI